MKWNGAEISVWNMEDARMEWNERISFILSYQFHTRFCALYSQKNTYQCRVVINNIFTEVFNFNIYACYLSTNRGTLFVYVAQTAYVLYNCKYIAICSIDVIVDNFNRFDLFFLRLTICQVLDFVFLHRHENFYLLFHSRFSLFLFIFLVFQLTIILFGVKAWYFDYGKCYLAVSLWPVLKL